MDGIGIMCARPEYGDWDAVESVEGILDNILSRLPVKTLGMCKSVSKHWCRLISRPHFVKLQLSWSRESLDYIIFPHDDLSDIVTNVFLMDDGEIAETFNLPGFEDLCTPNMISSLNGLVCCTNNVSSTLDIFDLDIRICNPITQDVLLLPKGRPSAKEPSVGLAFGPENNEYKVYHFFYNECESDDEHCECEIYSSKTGSWRGIGRVALCPMVNRYYSFSSDHVFVSGKLYWFISSEKVADIPGSLFSVDKDENFRRISLPDKVTAWSFLIDLEGSPSLVTIDDCQSIVDIWVLQNEDESIWSLKASTEFYIENIVCLDSVAARKNEIFFIIKDTYHSPHYLIYNVDLGTWRVLNLANTLGGCSPVAFPFIRSLLPCRGILRN